eukprot:GHVT01068471.1.p1 GENE.GHVT01068471.1~~GHVT01068471.1.p1  ORF type:complete len:432 (+),score=19.47 GHVT01068471.1:808-2103(+)
MKAWTGAAACTAALALLLGLSDFATCNEINGSQLDNFPSLDAGTSQADASLSLGANTLTGDSLYSDEAQTCMTVQTGMQASAREPVFASKHASRRSKLQSNGSASGLAATQTKGPSRKLKKRHVFIGLGAISIPLAAALGGGFLAWRSSSTKPDGSSTTPSPTSSGEVDSKHEDTSPPSSPASSEVVDSKPKDTLTTSSSTSPGKVHSKPDGISGILSYVISDPESQLPTKPADGVGLVTLKVIEENGDMVTKRAKLPMESNRITLRLSQGRGDRSDQKSYLFDSFISLGKFTNADCRDALVHEDGLTAFRTIMLREMFSLSLDEASKLQGQLYTEKNYSLNLDLEHPIKTFPVMAEVEKVYKADPNDWQSVVGVLFEYFSRGQFTRKTAVNSQYYDTVCEHVAKRLDKIPKWVAKFPPTVAALVKRSKKA